MSDELMNRAREFLALRDKATPGPWKADYWESLHQVHGWHEYSCVSLPEHPGSPRTLNVVGCTVEANRSTYDPTDKANSEFIATAHDMADTIRDLLAEVERLTVVAAEHRDGRLAALERALAAESRLRELASAEPMAFIGQHPDFPDEQSAYLGSEPDEPGHIPLIRRPEMPS